MIAALVLLAAIVSDNAKEFFTGGEWLPDAVSASAIYQGDPYKEELRLTTNVCAGVASLYSGLFERDFLGNGGSLGDGEGNPIPFGGDAFKTNRFMIVKIDNRGDISGAFLDTDTTHKLVNTYRVVDYNSITNIQALLRYVANGVWRNYWLMDDWDNHYWGSSWLNGDEFPAWDWTSDNFEQSTFTNVWPQYTSCPADGVWRTEPHTRRGALVNALGSFSIFNDDDQWGVDELCAVIGTNATPRSLFPLDLSAAYLDDMYSGKFGSATPMLMAGFTNDTYRLDYWRLAALETAVASMDTTYTDKEPRFNDWNVERRNHFHQKGQSCQVSPAAVATDFDKMTASLLCDFDFKDFETWNTVTNTSRQAENPEYVCRSDTASGSGTINGSCGLYVTYEALSNTLSLVESRAGVLYPKLCSGGIELLAYPDNDQIKKVLSVSNGEWTVTASASASRSVSVDYTTDLTNTFVEAVEYPTPWAWAHGMVKDRVNALEWRCSNTNFEYYTDAGGSYPVLYKPEAAQHRSVYVGEYATTNAFLVAWRNARKAHRDAIGAYSIANVGCSLKNRETLIPIGGDAVKHVVEFMPKSLTCDIGVRLLFDLIDVTLNNNGVISFVGRFYDRDLVSSDQLHPGDVRQLGYLTFTYDLSVPVDSYITLHPDRFTTGDISPAQRIRWKFQNLHEE